MPNDRRAMTLVRVLSGTFLATLIAAGTALALAGPGPGVAPPGPDSRTAAQAAAEDILAAFAAPAGAVAMSSDPTARLGSPSDPIPVAGGADLHRFLFVAGDPQRLINSISYQSALPVILGQGVVSASEIYDLGSAGGLVRRLEIQATPLGGGRSALRIDAQAWSATAERRPTAQVGERRLRSFG